MNKKTSLLVFALFSYSISFSKNLDKYSTLTTEAQNHYQLKNYSGSAEKYKQAFDSIDGKAYPEDRYHAACAYSMATNADLSFYHLMRLANDGDFKNHERLSSDICFNAIGQDKRWETLIITVKDNKYQAEKDLDHKLVTQLAQIHQQDQKYRNEIDAIEKKYGRDSEEIQAHWQLINDNDAINLVQIIQILDTKGWLGKNIIGEQGNSTLFLVIQHAEIETQLKYLPMMREAVKQGNANASSLALLEDRIAMRQGKRQIYGSQIGFDQESGKLYVFPLIDPENVDKRRAEVGLGTMSEYVVNFDIQWDIAEHKKRTTKIEAEKKTKN